MTTLNSLIWQRWKVAISSHRANSLQILKMWCKSLSAKKMWIMLQIVKSLNLVRVSSSSSSSWKKSHLVWESSEDPLCSLVIPNMASARERNHHHSKDILLTPTPLKAKEKSTKKTSFLDFFSWFSRIFCWFSRIFLISRFFPDFLEFFPDFLDFFPDFLGFFPNFLECFPDFLESFLIFSKIFLIF